MLLLLRIGCDWMSQQRSNKKSTRVPSLFTFVDSVGSSGCWPHVLWAFAPPGWLIAIFNSKQGNFHAKSSSSTDELSILDHRTVPTCVRLDTDIWAWAYTVMRREGKRKFLCTFFLVCWLRHTTPQPPSWAQLIQFILESILNRNVIFRMKLTVKAKRVCERESSFILIAAVFGAWQGSIIINILYNVTLGDNLIHQNIVWLLRVIHAALSIMLPMNRLFIAVMSVTDCQLERSWDDGSSNYARLFFWHNLIAQFIAC